METFQELIVFEGFGAGSSLRFWLLALALWDWQIDGVGSGLGLGM